LSDQGLAGVEFQLFRGDDFANGRLYPSRGRARGVSLAPAADTREGMAGDKINDGRLVGHG
jgi:hypothetical protein